MNNMIIEVTSGYIHLHLFVLDTWFFLSLFHLFSVFIFWILVKMSAKKIHYIIDIHNTANINLPDSIEKKFLVNEI